MSEILPGIMLLLGGGGFATVAVKVLERRKVVAETHRTDAEAGMTDAQRTDIITQASERAVAMLGSQLETAYKRIRFLEGRVSVLESEIRSAGRLVPPVESDP